MPPLKDFIPEIKDLPLRTINGASEENVELRVARDIREIEVRMGQRVGTMDIPKFIVAINERHGLVPPEKVDKLCGKHFTCLQLYDRTAAFGHLACRHQSYLAEQWTTGVGEAAHEIGSTMRAYLSKPQKTWGEHRRWVRCAHSTPGPAGRPARSAAQNKSWRMPKTGAVDRVG